MFFTLSGLFLAVSLCRKDTPNEDPALSSFAQIKKRVGGVYIDYITAIAVYLVTALIILIINHDASFLDVLLGNIPDILMMQGSSLITADRHLGVLWYLSTMFITMLPLIFMFKRNKDFTLYIFAPLTAVICYGFMFSNNPLAGYDANFGIIPYGVIRALCGLCFGFVSYLIYKKLSAAEFSKKARVLLTAGEAAIYLLILYSLVLIYPTLDDGADFYTKLTLTLNATYSAMLLTPVAFAIALSGKSYISHLFKFGFMKYFGYWSLQIFLMHFIAWTIVSDILDINNWKIAIMLMAAFTVVLSIVSYAITSAVKAVINRKKLPTAQ